MKIGDSVVVSAQCGISCLRDSEGIIEDIQLTRKLEPRIRVRLNNPIHTLAGELERTPFLPAAHVVLKEV